MSGGFDQEYPDQSVKEDEQCMNCKKNPLSGTLPWHVIVRLIAIAALLSIAAFSIGMYYAHNVVYVCK